MKSIIGCALILSMVFCMPLGASNQAEQGILPEAALFSGLKLRNIGPALTSGRISDIAIHPRDHSTWYIAVGSGGVWKTVNCGTTWEPVFDNQTSYSIGCVAIDPIQPEVVWVGTGENVSGRHVGFGDGIYKSSNGGKTWKNMGLKHSEHISQILIDPRDSRVIYVAAEGPLWSSGGERGLYKSTNGGETWELSLSIGKDTGVTAAAFEPGNPDTIYAAAYQRRRSVAAFMGGGPESGIYKTTDAGKQWRKLTHGLPRGNMGRIGLAVSPLKPNIVYATIEAMEKEKGFYRSQDRGESWEKRNSYTSSGTGPHYYQEIYADPRQVDRVYQMDVWMHVTEDGGKTFRKVGEKYKHSDNHALAFDLHDPGYLLAGCDGGLYETWDRGKTWKFIANLPVTQFYKLALDNALPFYNVHGGAQDNGSQMGPSQSLNINGIMNSDWFFSGGADGYTCAFDPTDDNIIYTEWQAGKLERYDKRSGEIITLQPQPEPGDDRGDTWTPISPDLSRGIFRLEQEIMGKKWSSDALWDHDAMSYFGNLTSLSESPLQEGLIYAGTDDGLIQVTEDGGKNWRKIEKLPGVPAYFFANDIKASLHDVNTVYAALDNHKTGDLKPYLLKSTDRGRTWTSMLGDLPQRLIVWAIAQDHVKPDLFFIGTEFGLFFTLDSGKRWIKLSGGVPTISFRDIEIQPRENDLVGASFGRGFFILDDYSPLRYIDEKTLEEAAVLFPVKKALMYIPRKPLELDDKAFLGDAFYIAPNPPFGAVFTYYLSESLKTPKQLRQETEKNLEKEGKPLPFPGWDALRQEDREEEPAIILTVKDQDGHVVRRLTGPTGKGFHRVNWDLRYPATTPTRLKQPTDVAPWDQPPQGPLVVPGTFSVSMARQVEGVLTPLAKPQAVIVESLALATLPAKDRGALLAFQEKAGELPRAMKGTEAALVEALYHIEVIKKALPDTPRANPQWAEQARTLENQLKDLEIALSGDPTIRDRYEPRPPSLLERVSKEAMQVDSTTGITATNQRNYEIAADAFEQLLGKLRQLIEVELKALEEKMEAAGAPWTPGRGLPKWKKDRD
jgi:photosystem II stability/assembly factor-like uncharacterized protein/tetratricopeptide (TPR) repeat protein